MTTSPRLSMAALSDGRVLADALAESDDIAVSARRGGLRRPGERLRGPEGVRSCRWRGKGADEFQKQRVENQGRVAVAAQGPFRARNGRHFIR